MKILGVVELGGFASSAGSGGKVAEDEWWVVELGVQ
jgi:hypothetical protein